MILSDCTRALKMSLDPWNAQGVVPPPPVAYQRSASAIGKAPAVRTCDPGGDPIANRLNSLNCLSCLSRALPVIPSFYVASESRPVVMLSILSVSLNIKHRCSMHVVKATSGFLSQLEKKSDILTPPWRKSVR